MLTRGQAIAVVASFAGAVGIMGAAQLDFGGVTKIGEAGALKTGAVTLAEGANVTITDAGNTITIAASGGGGGGTDWADSLRLAGGTVDGDLFAQLTDLEGDTLDVTSIAKSGSSQLTGDVTLSGGTGVSLSQVSQDINFAATLGTDIAWTECQAAAQESAQAMASYVMTYDADRVASYKLVIDDAADTLTNKTLTTPTIASMTNAQHDHADAAGGAQLDSTAFADEGLGLSAIHPGETTPTDGHVLTWDTSNDKWQPEAAPATSSPLTTKGDLHVYTTVDARLPVGTNDYVLTADSGEASGVKWAAAAGGGGLTKCGSVAFTFHGSGSGAEWGWTADAGGDYAIPAQLSWTNVNGELRVDSHGGALWRANQDSTDSDWLIDFNCPPGTVINDVFETPDTVRIWMKISSNTASAGQKYRVCGWTVDSSTFDADNNQWNLANNGVPDSTYTDRVDLEWTTSATAGVHTWVSQDWIVDGSFDDWDPANDDQMKFWLYSQPQAGAYAQVFYSAFYFEFITAVE
jgi:hypothetical protein